MQTISEKVKVSPTSSNKLSTQISPEDTLLKYMHLDQLHLLRIPKVQEILNWAEIAPKSKIYFIVNRAYLEPEEIKRLKIVENMLKPASNIQVVDSQQFLTGDAFKHLKDSCISAKVKSHYSKFSQKTNVSTFKKKSEGTTFEGEIDPKEIFIKIRTCNKAYGEELNPHIELYIQKLPKYTPLMFQWKHRGYGISNVTIDEKYYYMQQLTQRLLDCAEREPQRKIYLVVNVGNGVHVIQRELEKLKKALEPTSNIQVVDYQQLLIGEDKHLKDDYTAFTAQRNYITFKKKLKGTRCFKRYIYC